MSDFQLAVVFALVAAVLFGIGAQLTRLGLRSIDPRTGAFVTIVSSTALYWMAAPWYLHVEFWRSGVVWLFVLVGFFRPVLSLTFSIAGTAKLGPTISTALSATSPLFGLLFGVFILNEVFTWTIALGVMGMVAGVALLAFRGRVDVRTNWPLWALSLPIMAALIRVAAHLLTKIGLETLPSPYFAGLVGHTASLIIALSYQTVGRRPMMSLTRNPDARWFLVTGALFALAVFFLNVALQRGPLSVVAPLASLEALVVLILGVAVFREQTITRRVVFAVVMIVAGAAAISMRE